MSGPEDPRDAAESRGETQTPEQLSEAARILGARATSPTGDFSERLAELGIDYVRGVTEEELEEGRGWE